MAQIPSEKKSGKVASAFLDTMRTLESKVMSGIFYKHTLRTNFAFMYALSLMRLTASVFFEGGIFSGESRQTLHAE